MKKVKSYLIHKYLGEITGTIWGPCLTIVTGTRSLPNMEIELLLDNGDRLVVPDYHLLTVTQPHATKINGDR